MVCIFVNSPVTLDLVTALLDVSEASTGVALLLVGMVTVPGHMAGLATVITDLQYNVII